MTCLVVLYFFSVHVFCGPPKTIVDHYMFQSSGPRGPVHFSDPFAPLNNTGHVVRTVIPSLLPTDLMNLFSDL